MLEATLTLLHIQLLWQSELKHSGIALLSFLWLANSTTEIVPEGFLTRVWEEHGIS